jgi:hypothetical protein
VGALLGTLLTAGRNATARPSESTTVKGVEMPDHTFADLLAGVIDLAPSGTPPHPPGPCTALCVPACVGGPAGTGAAEHDPGPSGEQDQGLLISAARAATL